MTGRNKGQGRQPPRLFPARLIVFRQYEEASARAVRAAKRQHSKRRSSTALQQMTLTSARFLMVLTSVPAGAIATSPVLAAYRLRWQVELAFKRLESGLGIDRLLARDPAMARSWLLSHLVLALLIENGASEVPDSPLCMMLVTRAPFPCGVCVWSSGSRCSAPVLSTSSSMLLGQLYSFITRHICDPPRPRSCQSALARSRPPLAP